MHKTIYQWFIPFFLLGLLNPVFAGEVNFIKELSVGGKKQVDIQLLDLLENNQQVSKLSDFLQKITWVEIKEGQNLVISRSEIIKKLKKAKREYSELRTLNFRIPIQIKLIHHGLELKKITVSNGLKKLWRRQCRACQFVIENITLPELSDEYKNQPWHLQTSTNPPQGRFSAQLIFPKIRNSISMWVTGQAQTRKPVLVVKKNIAKGDSVNIDEVDIKYKNIEQVRGGLLDISQLEGKITNRYLMSGDTLKSSYLASKILFRRGDAVKIIYKNESFQIVSQGVAESMGKVGQSVWVKNLNSKKRISGVVSQSGEVVVQ